MNRRSFLKSLGVVCGAAVVCPDELLKDEPVEFRPNPAQRVYMIDHPVFHTQQHFMSRASGYIVARDKMLKAYQGKYY
ncbi:twin-arginine translocation signal domain-containing protein [Candidatus Pacearchaeota archaeon]|nr:twin-arginine translocation signal domain-containing protein [Candidatus Pacearchaeota archaeon]